MSLSSIRSAIKDWYRKNFTFTGIIAFLFALYCAIPDYEARNDFWISKMGTLKDFLIHHFRLVLGIVAILVIWLDHRRVIAKSRPKPSGLKLNIESLLYQYDAEKDLTVFVLSIYLVNTGAPTIASGWMAKFIVGTSVEDMRGFFIKVKYELKIGDDTISLVNDNLIQSKVLTHQIATGDARAGRVIFSVSGDRVPQVKSLQFKIQVTCHDYLEKAATSMFAPDPKPMNEIKMYPWEVVRTDKKEPDAVSMTQPKLLEANTSAKGNGETTLHPAPSQ